MFEKYMGSNTQDDCCKLVFEFWFVIGCSKHELYNQCERDSENSFDLTFMWFFLNKSMTSIYKYDNM